MQSFFQRVGEGCKLCDFVVIQALTAAGASQSSWNCVDAVEFLISEQTGGDFGGVGATSQIIPFLNCNNFGSLRDIDVQCGPRECCISLSVYNI